MCIRDRLQDDVEETVSARPARKGKADPSLHGTRAPVSGPKPKKKNPSPSKRTTEPTKERNPRTTSKRVTPKKADLEAAALEEKSNGRKKRSFAERLEAAQQAQDEKRRNKKK